MKNLIEGLEAVEESVKVKKSGKSALLGYGKLGGSLKINAMGTPEGVVVGAEHVSMGPSGSDWQTSHGEDDQVLKEILKVTKKIADEYDNKMHKAIGDVVKKYGGK